MSKRRTRRLSTSGDCVLTESDGKENEEIIESTTTKKQRLNTARRSIGGRRSSGNFEGHISQIYTDCIQQAAKNKINMANAWKAKLVDVMDKILTQDVQEKKKQQQQKPGDPKVTSFQVASNALDASAKIYSFRVDSVHNDTYRVLSGLNRSASESKKQTSEEPGEYDDAPVEKVKKRKTVSLSHTLDSISNLNSKKLDREFAVDPLFHKTAAAFDEGGAKGLLLSQLGVSEGCNIVFDSTEYHPDEIVPSQEVYDSSFLSQFINPDWENSLVCPFFQEFSFSQEDNDDEMSSSQPLPPIDMDDYDDNTDYDDYTSTFELLSQRQELDSSQDFNSSPMSNTQDNNTPISPPELPEDELASQMDGMSLEPISDMPEYFDDDVPDFGAPTPDYNIPSPDDTISQLLEGTPNIPSIDVIKNLVSDNNDYDYFNNSLMKNWAGPEHWKFKVTKNKPLRQVEDGDEETQEAPKKKRTAKRDFFIDFFEEDDTDYESLLKPAKSGGKISKETMMNCTKPTTLPFVDIHYSAKNFAQLFCKPGKFISLREPISSKRGAVSNNEDFLSAPMIFEGCDEPLIDGGMDTYEEHDDNGEFGFIDSFPDSQSAPEFNFASQSSQFSELVDAPDSVQNIKISYARRAKRVDIEKLKTSIWTELCTDDTSSSEEERNIKEDVSETKIFSQVLTTLPKSVHSSQMSDLSVPLCFICLLDLANKKGLQIDQMDEDLRITKYQKVTE